MEFDLRQAIESLDQNEVFEIANGARPAKNYLFNSILPNRNMTTYDYEGGALTIRTTMAGLSGMDSEYNETGLADSQEWTGRSIKLTATRQLPEKFLRQLQDAMTKLMAQNMGTEQLIRDTGLNLVNKLIVQALLDREEWLKGQALFTGKIDWTMNGKRVNIDYGIPADHFLPARTGNDRYGGTTSKLWADITEAQRLLNYDIRAIVMHPSLLADIMANAEVNQLEFVSMNAQSGVFSFRRIVNRAGNTVLDSDPRSFVTFIAYKEETELWDTTSSTGGVKIPFCPVGGMLFIGAPTNNNVFEIGIGSTEPPPTTTPVSIGYGHVAPTTEGGGRPGRWSRLYVPEKEPWALATDGVENFVPVIQNEKRLVIANSQVGA